ncbi:SSI family serine proteinase inhibitor [Nonomuraea sp. NPDC050404]|uniref:SSI family serine proteinase inhibitor n=1 Tax=Nonomuraea sp. NPDC050404 TaxID=3155783 RepID=UPI0033D1A208
MPLLITGAGLCAGLVLTAIPAQGAARPNSVVLTVTAHGSSSLKMVTLRCPGLTRGHPYGEVVCAVIDAVEGDFDRLPGDPGRRCSEKRDPVAATMYGMWRNRTIGWQKTFPNACALTAETGPIFRF